MTNQDIPTNPNQLNRSIDIYKIFVAIIIIALFVISYLFPVVPSRIHLSIIDRMSFLDFGNTMFLTIFLPIFLLLYFLIPGRRSKNVVLFVFSLVFISWGAPYYILLFLTSSGFTYFMSRKIYYQILDDNNYGAYNTLSFGRMMHICILILFGFSNSYLFSIKSLFNASFGVKSIIIPIGIVVYSLHGISLLSETYNGLNVGKIKYIDVALYMGMFPRLIVGPYESAYKIITQIHIRKERIDLVGEGAIRFIIGLIKKVFIANNIYYLFGRFLTFKSDELSAANAWLGAFSLVFAIYFALSGYTDMSIGLGKILGFEFRDNFKEPFKASSLMELKDRFMISLFEWIREYIYLPLSNLTDYYTVSIPGVIASTFVFVILMGFDGRFIVSAIFFSIAIYIETKIKNNKISRKHNIGGLIYTKIIMAIGLVMCSAPNIKSAFAYIKSMLLLNGRLFDKASAYYFRTYLVIFALLILVSTPSLFRRIIKKISRR